MTASASSFRPAFWRQGPLLIGHRGAAGLAPENTLAGFRRAWELGVDAVELDVHRLGERLVVIHDDTLDRTTSGRGPIADLSWEELCHLDAGAGERVPSLDAVLAALPTACGLNVELKGPDTAALTARHLAGWQGGPLLVSSFDHAELAAFRALDGATPVAPLFSRLPRGRRGDPHGPIWRLAGDLDACAVNVAQRLVTAELVAGAVRERLGILVYTVNDAEQARRLLDLGVTGLFTDRPDLIGPCLPAARTRASARSSDR